MVASGSVGAEFVAVMRAITFCERKGATRIVVHHDYVGIVVRPGDGRRISAAGRRYARFMGSRLRGSHLASGGAEITFRRVRAHSGHHLNNAADRLAGQGARSAR